MTETTKGSKLDPLKQNNSKPWTENLSFIGATDDDFSTPDNPTNNITFNIASFNILAESYLHPRSHTNLPPQYASVAFDPSQRQTLLRQTLLSLAKSFDILCLQELDVILHSHVIQWLSLEGFHYVYAPRGNNVITSVFCSNNDSQLVEEKNSDSNVEKNATEQSDPQLKLNKDSRADGCAIFFKASIWKCTNYQDVQFDDLADENREPIVHSNIRNYDKDYQHDNYVKLATNNDLPIQKKIHKKTSSNRNSSNNPLCGIITSYKRCNVALVIELQHVTHPNHNIIVANTHLYWHPGYEYVKLSQAYYLVQKIKQITTSNFTNKKNIKSNTISNTDTQNDDISQISPPVFICGDFNSKPNSVVYNFFSKGFVDARLVAPWHYFYNEIEEESYKESEDNNNDCNISLEQLTLVDDELKNQQRNPSHHDNHFNSFTDEDPIVGLEELQKEFENESKQQLNQNLTNTNDIITKDKSEHDSFGSLPSLHRNISPVIPSSSNKSVPTVRYLLDFTLNKLTRWLRILGIDAALETEEEERERTGKGNMLLFKRCRDEKRTLITTSYKLIIRKDCPPGTYLIHPQKSTSHLEQSLVHILSLHGVPLQPRNFLSRCVVCNGSIIDVEDEEEKRIIFQTYNSPDFSKNLDVFKCTGCGQGYWWSESPTSSASRVKDATANLLSLCVRGGIALEGDLDFFDFVDVEKERAIGEEMRRIRHSNTDGVITTGDGIAEVLSWLKEAKLSNPFVVKSACSVVSEEGNDESCQLPFTNVTSGFIGTLDYIFYEPSKIKRCGVLKLPTTLRQLNHSKIPNGHLLPSNIWPSDHLVIGAKFEFIAPPIKNEKSKEDQSNIKAASANNNIPSKITVTNDESRPKIDNTPKHSAPQLGCSCGCVPKIKSLFEMAELRKQARLKKESMDQRSTRDKDITKSDEEVYCMPVVPPSNKPLEK